MVTACHDWEPGFVRPGDGGYPVGMRGSTERSRSQDALLLNPDQALTEGRANAARSSRPVPAGSSADSLREVCARRNDLSARARSGHRLQLSLCASSDCIERVGPGRVSLVRERRHASPDRRACRLRRARSGLVPVARRRHPERGQEAGSTRRQALYGRRPQGPPSRRDRRSAFTSRGGPGLCSCRDLGEAEEFPADEPAGCDIGHDGPRPRDARPRGRPAATARSVLEGIRTPVGRPAPTRGAYVPGGLRPAGHRHGGRLSEGSARQGPGGRTRAQERSGQLAQPGGRGPVPWHNPRRRARGARSARRPWPLRPAPRRSSRER